jgi:hypothetical protein
MATYRIRREVGNKKVKTDGNKKVKNQDRTQREEESR